MSSKFVVTPEPIRTTVRPGKRFDEDKVAERLCRVMADDGVAQQSGFGHGTHIEPENASSPPIADKTSTAKPPSAWGGDDDQQPNDIEPGL